jgi:predicted adenylyl cyclase CyaB
MARNIEIKANIRDLDSLVSEVTLIADSGPVVIDQDDTFFHCPDGRLKLRELSANQGELILYHRPDVSGPKTSTYVISQTSEPGKMREILSAALGVAGRVRKRRHLYLCGSTRIHIDDVEGLGNFVELEVVLENSDSVESGHQIAEELMTRLGIQSGDLVEGAYIDMIPVSFN